MNAKTREDFTAYADVCFREFGDRVKYWITVNEPNIEPILGHDLGIFPPNHCSSSLAPSLGLNCSKGNSSVEPYIAGHNLLLSHASAVSLYRKKYQVLDCKSTLLSHQEIITINFKPQKQKNRNGLAQKLVLHIEQQEIGRYLIEIQRGGAGEKEATKMAESRGDEEEAVKMAESRGREEEVARPKVEATKRAARKDAAKRVVRREAAKREAAKRAVRREAAKKAVKRVVRREAAKRVVGPLLVSKQ
ncbi:hypothetical protein ZIOFF_009968 [Zingiber officinale]|uniref:Uncharacterized protein n=1 Tax=Zingiber officinale TaxID=94328 RepID=A0A8J5HLK3_ZINOF|nr:hypothetical protein ZIOFF_009968 [Zingiber officinale]